MRKPSLFLLFSVLILGCQTPTSDNGAVSYGGPVSASSLGLTIDQSKMIPEGRYARKSFRQLKPVFITVHSTQNTHSSADARKHAIALENGRLTSRNNSLGYLSWHYTVDQSKIYQSLPDNQQGQHADYEGHGNRYSIGIEMCENSGNSRAATLDHTARLIAYLLKKHDIPLRNVVPHAHWRRIRFSDRRDLGFKNCPHFLLDNGKVGAKWDQFKNQIKRYL